MERWDCSKAGIPVYSWAVDIDATARQQIEHLAKLPFAYHHIAIMPDCYKRHL